MAIRRFKPTKDAFIVKGLENVNTGRDEILELGYLSDSESEGPMRVLMSFDTASINKVLSTLSVEYKATLKLFNSTRENLPETYSIICQDLVESWNEGLGKSVEESNWSKGVTWKYRKDDIQWSVLGGTTGSLQTTQSFDKTQLGDINLNVTPFVSASKCDYLLKFADESKIATDKTRTSFFSSETHTIYSPYLEISWKDSKNESELNVLSSNYKVSAFSKDALHLGEEVKISVGVHPKFPSRTISTSSLYLDRYRLPETSTWGVKDIYTGEMVIPFDNPGTLLSSDNSGNYFILDTKLLEPERFVELLIRVGSEIIETGYTFKVCQN